MSNSRYRSQDDHGGSSDVVVRDGDRVTGNGIDLHQSAQLESTNMDNGVGDNASVHVVGSDHSVKLVGDDGASNNTSSKVEAEFVSSGNLCNQSAPLPDGWTYTETGGIRDPWGSVEEIIDGQLVITLAEGQDIEIGGVSFCEEILKQETGSRGTVTWNTVGKEV